MILRETLVIALLGGAAGLAGAMAGGRLLGNLLFRVSPLDPVTLAAGSLLLLCVALLASLLPARRAARIDPVTALREE